MERDKFRDGNNGPTGTRGLDCALFEELDQRLESLNDDELLWYSDHVRTCALGIHTLAAEAELSSLGLQEVLDRLEDPAGPDPTEVEALLLEAEAIERGPHCYEIPGGFHTDVHINAGRLCYSEEWIERAARLIEKALGRAELDTIVSVGWPMATITRRLLRDTRRAIQHIVAEGYGPPELLGSVEERARVAILLDVGVTGRLVSDLSRELKRQGAQLVGAIALVDGGPTPNARLASFRGLCVVHMNLTPAENCRRSAAHPPVTFNPRLGATTNVKSVPRSVTGHLQQHPESAELWELANQANAVEQHHLEGRRHYVPFIDTLKLLRYPSAAAALVGKLAARVMEEQGPPDVIVVRARGRSTMLGEKLVAAFGVKGAKVDLAVARVRQGRFCLGSDCAVALTRKSLLVADTATAHGETIDELTLLALEAGASQIGAAVVLSHLSDACEEALRSRLSRGFLRLYSFPRRPWNDTCPICVEVDRLRWVLEALPDGPVRRAARWELAQLERPRPGEQLTIRFSATYLSVWRSRAVGGAASDTVAAVLGDGMAPISLPEIQDRSIPLKNRVALVRALRRQQLGRSGSSVQHELLDYLRRQPVEPQLWLETVKLLEKQGTSSWISCLQEQLDRRASWMTRRVCAQLALCTYVTSDEGQEVRNRLTELARRYATSEPGRVLVDVLAETPPTR